MWLWWGRERESTFGAILVVIKNTETPEIMSQNLTFKILLEIKRKLHQWMAAVGASYDRNH